jgi:hypothetical protein
LTSFSGPAVIDEDAVGEEASEPGLELVQMGVDEARHDDHARRLDDLGIAGFEIRADLLDGAAGDQHVGLGEIADVRVHGEHVPAPDQDAPAFLARAGGHFLGIGGTRREKPGRRCRSDDHRSLQKVASRFAVDRRPAGVTHICT